MKLFESRFPLVVLSAVACLALVACEPKGAPVGKTTEPAGGTAEKKAASEGAPIKVGAILAITGPASFLGAPEAKTLEMLAEKVNSSGGVLGRKIQLIIKDSKADPGTAKSLAGQLIEEEKVLAILGPSTSGETDQIKETCQTAKTILISCAAAEKIVNPLAPYVFKSPQKDSDAARLIYKTMKEMGITKVGVMASNTGFGSEGRKQLEKYASEYGITIAIAETYNKEATDLTASLTKVKGENVGAVVNWSIEPAQAILAKNMRQLEFKVPLFQSHGFGNLKYVEMSGEAAEGTIFPAGRLLVADVLPDGHPQKALLIQYKKDYEEKYKEAASTFGGHAYDAWILLVAAIVKAGSAETDKVRDTLENLGEVVGTGGIFKITKDDHNGLGMDAFEMLTVKDGKFALYKK
jgi:branched-chain amino acid transport system substrate-binding protein